MLPFLPLLAAAVVLNDSTATLLPTADVQVLSAAHEIPPWRSWYSLPDSEFRAFAGSKPDLSPSPILLRIPIRVPHPGRWWLVSDYGLFQPRIQFGSNLLEPTVPHPFRDWSVLEEVQAYPLDLTDSIHQIHFLVSDHRAKASWGRLGMRLVPDRDFPALLGNRTVATALVFGFSVALVGMAAFLWLAVREAALAWYTGYLIGYLLWFTFISGFCRSRIWPDSHLFSCLAVGSVTFFAASLFSARRKSNWLTRLLQGLAISNFLVALGLVLDLSLPWFAADLVQIAGLLSLLLILAFNAPRDPIARKLLFAFSLPVAATVLGSLTEINFAVSYALKKSLIVHCVLVENVLTMLILTREILRREKRRLVLERDFHGKVSEQSDKFRQAVAHDLHDDLSQRILAVRMALYQETRESGGLPASVEAQFQDLADAVREVSHQLSTSGGSGNLHSALAELARTMSGENLAIELDLAFEREHLPSVNLELFRIVQEALSNAVRHGRATRVAIRTRPCPEGMELSIRDDGVGMDATASTAGLGLEGIRSRAARLGGSLEIATAKGQGTRISVRIPFGTGAARQ